MITPENISVIIQKKLDYTLNQNKIESFEVYETMFVDYLVFFGIKIVVNKKLADQEIELLLDVYNKGILEHEEFVRQILADSKKAQNNVKISSKSDIDCLVDEVRLVYVKILVEDMDRIGMSIH